MLCSANGFPGPLPSLLDGNLQNEYLGDLGRAFLLGCLFVSFIVVSFCLVWLECFDFVSFWGIFFFFTIFSLYLRNVCSMS